MKKIVACTSMMVLMLVAVIGGEALQVKAKEWEVQSKEKSKVMGSNVSNWIKPDEESLNDYDIGVFESTLPILHINTNGQQISKDEKTWSMLAVTDVNADGTANSIMETPDYESAITINTRGASSYSQFDKKQYRIKFYKEEGSTKVEEYEFLGMGSNSEWVLNGPFLDRTLIRNRLVYGIGREIFEWAPDCRYVELFLDGEYQGVYLAVEPVTNGVNRLRLSEFGLSSGETAYIVKRDRVGTEAEPLYVYGYYGGKTNNSLYIDYPSTTKLTQMQKEWITQDIDIFEHVLYGDNFDDVKEGYAKYLDVDNFVDYFILNEVVMNNDAGNLSTYIYKELNGKLKIAIWDYNNCFDNYQWFAQDYSEFFLQDNAWFSRLIQDRAFVDKVVERYYELRKGVLSEEYLYGQIDTYIDELGPAVSRNFAIWGYTFYGRMLADETELHINPRSYDQAVEQLKGSIHERVTFLDEHIIDLYQGCVN